MTHTERSAKFLYLELRMHQSWQFRFAVIVSADHNPQRHYRLESMVVADHVSRRLRALDAYMVRFFNLAAWVAFAVVCLIVALLPMDWRLSSLFTDKPAEGPDDGTSAYRLLLYGGVFEIALVIVAVMTGASWAVCGPQAAGDRASRDRQHMLPARAARCRYHGPEGVANHVCRYLDGRDCRHGTEVRLYLSLACVRVAGPAEPSSACGSHACSRSAMSELVYGLSRVRCPAMFLGT